MLFQISPDWITDPKTKKQYLILSTDNLKYDEVQQVCHNLGAFLPEPRNHDENQFLDDLGSHMFALGMTDKKKEGTWVYETDGAEVTLDSWIYNEPNGKRIDNCALMIRDHRDYSEHTNQWLDYSCSLGSVFGSSPKSVVCQRNTGMCIL